MNHEIPTKTEFVFDPLKLSIADLPGVRLQGRQELPPVPSVYFVVDGSGIIRYIGQSESLKRRWSNHGRLAQLIAECEDAVIRFLEVKDRRFRLFVEATCISHFDPKMNNHGRDYIGQFCSTCQPQRKLSRNGYTSAGNQKLRCGACGRTKTLRDTFPASPPSASQQVTLRRWRLDSRGGGEQSESEPHTPARSCPKCDRLHLKINSYSTAGNAQWLCRVDRKAPDGLPGCGYAETPDRVTPPTKAERSRNERQRREARKALGEGDVE